MSRPNLAQDKTQCKAANVSSRYERQLALPGVGFSGQEKLKNAKVLIVGLGGLGGPVALYLAAAGIGHLLLVDNDIVSLSNLQRQILFSTAQVGSSKVLAAQKHLLALNPEIKVTVVNERFQIQNARELVNRCDVVIDGSDNFQTRYIVNDACVLENKPLVFGAVFRFDAQVSVFAQKSAPCYRCLYPQPPGVEASPNCSDAGVLGVLPGTAGTLMATEALKLILGIGESLAGFILAYDSLNMQFFRLQVARRSSCEVCGENPRIHDVTDGVLDADLPHAEISVTEMTARLKSPLDGQIVIDVRNEDEFSFWHLPDSLNWPLAHLADKIKLIPKQSQIILVCQTGVRSRRAYRILSENGHQNMASLSGGLAALCAAGFELEGDPPRMTGPEN